MKFEIPARLGVCFFAVLQLGAADTNPGVEDAKVVVSRFLQPGANHEKLSRELIPQQKDCQKYFSEPALAATACATYTKMLAKGGISPKPGQSEVLVWQATSEELVAGTGDATHFPGGYKQAAPSIQPNQIIFAFKFVKPGATTGMAFDGLTYINGQWRIFPKPWRLLK